MNKEIFISESMGESRIAIIEDGTLVEVYIAKNRTIRGWLGTFTMEL